MTPPQGSGAPPGTPASPESLESSIRPILAIDTATSMAVVATGDASGVLRREVVWPAGFRHGEELLARVAELLGDDGVTLDALSGIVVGTGPGAFTGLRIGLATAKTLAHELATPIVGVSTAAALADAATRRGVRGPLAVMLPAGPSAVVVVEPPAAGPGGPRSDGGPRLVVGPPPVLPDGVTAIAVDLDDRAPGAASALGERARAGLAASLIALGAARLDRGERDDVAKLVPEYGSLPRGVAVASGEVAWSLDRR